MPTRSISTLVGGVVADGDHHGGEVAQRDAGYAGRQTVHDVAVGNEIRGLHRVEVGELQLALLRLQVKVGEDCDLDGTCLGEDFVFMQEIVVAGGEVFDGDSHHAVEVLVDVLNAGFEFLPENFLLSGGGAALGNAGGKQDRTQQSNGFTGGSLMTAGIVAGSFSPGLPRFQPGQPRATVPTWTLSLKW